MPMYWDAYLADTTHLTTEEHGAYLLLLGAMWRRNGSVPDHDADNARILGLTKAKWRKIKARLAPFLTFEDGEISQKKLQKTWKNTQEKIDKNRSNGAKGGRPKSLKNNDLAKANGSVSDALNESIPEPEPDPEIEGVTHHQREDSIPLCTYPPGAVDDDEKHPPPKIMSDHENAPPARHDKRLTSLFDRVLEAAGADVRKDVSGKWFSSGQRGVVAMWLRETDLTDDQIVETVKEVRNAAGKQPSSLRYFSPAIAQRQHDEQRNSAGLTVNVGGRAATSETAAQRRARERLERDARIATDLDRRFGYADG